MNKIFFRIHTEYRDNLEQHATAWFLCFAIVRGRGFWRGIGEDSACIEIIADESQREAVRQLARDIKHYNNQEAVYITETPVDLHQV